MRRPINDKAVGAWRRYQPFLVHDMDALAAELSLAQYLGHRWDEDPLHIVAHRARLPAADEQPGGKMRRRLAQSVAKEVAVQS